MDMHTTHVLKFILFTFLTLSFPACESAGRKKHVRVSSETSACFPEKMYMFSPQTRTSSGDTLTKRVYLIPDSLLTPEEIRLKRQFQYLLLTHLTVENNRYVFHLPKDSFLRQGIPALYYDELIKGLEEINQWAEEMPVDSLAVLFEHAREEMRRQWSLP